LNELEQKYDCKIKVLKDPEAFLLMDRDTFLVPCHVPFDATEIALEVADEKGIAGLLDSCYIGTNHQQELEKARLDSNVPKESFGCFTSSQMFTWLKQCEGSSEIGGDQWYDLNRYIYPNTGK
jgi:hypothetical protein